MGKYLTNVEKVLVKMQCHEVFENNKGSQKAELSPRNGMQYMAKALEKVQR